MSDILYRKVGRRYHPVGPEFTGFPAEGLWLVMRNGQGWVNIVRLSDGKLDVPRIYGVQMRQLAEDAMRFAIKEIHEANTGTWSVADVTRIIADYFAYKLEEAQKGDE